MFKRMDWEQYDHMVMGDTIGKPGSESGVIRIHGHNKALAITTDCTPRYCSINSKLGASQAVAESYRNLCSVGARPLAITDCLNFGNPENDIVMGQIVDAIEGISEACKKLSMPVVAGNVSLYNETEGKSIPPTPQIGAVGIIDNLQNYTSNYPKNPFNKDIIILGETLGHLSCSIYNQVIENEKAGTLPPINLIKEKLYGNFILDMCSKNILSSCKDLSDGGIGIALSETCIMSGIGCKVESTIDNTIAWLFGEDQARYMITCDRSNTKEILAKAKKLKLKAKLIGGFESKYLQIMEKSGLSEKISVDKLKKLRNNWFINYFEK